MRYNSVKVAYDTLNEIMNSQAEQSFDTKYLPKYKLDGHIKFEDVHFEYEENKEVLKGVSFEIKPKDKIAVIGLIGSGKTTISKLIMGLYEQTQGNIYVDNFHISQIHPYDLRANIGYVPQDIFLFNGTIMENIMLNPLVKVDSKEGLNAAIKVSGIDKQFGKTADGLNTNVGEAGRKISGGQKQSIAIARAFANNPPVVLMDEPLSMMDKATSYDFLNRLHEYTRDKTLIVISHQLSVLNIVDKVLYLENGKIRFLGKKEDFLKNFTHRATEQQKQPTPPTQQHTQQATPQAQQQTQVGTQPAKEEKVAIKKDSKKITKKKKENISNVTKAKKDSK